jgi:hypothetical protein
VPKLEFLSLFLHKKRHKNRSELRMTLQTHFAAALKVAIYSYPTISCTPAGIGGNADLFYYKDPAP